MNYPVEYPQQFIDNIGTRASFFRYIVEIFKGSTSIGTKVVKPIMTDEFFNNQIVMLQRRGFRSWKIKTWI